MSNKLFLALLLSSIPLSACDRPTDPAKGDVTQASSDEAASAVKSVEAEMLAAFQAKDAAKAAPYYASDAIFAMPGRTVKGTEAIKKAITDDLGDPGFTLTFANEKTDVASSGDLAYTSGTFNVSYTNPQTKKIDKVAGTYVTVFRKQADGSWKAVADIATPSAPS